MDAFVTGFSAYVAKSIDAMARSLDIAFCGGFLITAVNVWPSPNIERLPVGQPIPEGYILVASAEDGGPLTREELKAALDLLQEG